MRLVIVMTILMAMTSMQQLRANPWLQNPSEISDIERNTIPDTDGPFTVRSYTQGLSQWGYQSARIYYPSNADGALLPSTTLSGGFLNSKEQMSWLAERLASHGIVVLVFTPSNRFSNFPAVWERGHKAAFNKLRAENSRWFGPLNGRLDLDRIGMIGYSLGGAGAVLASNSWNYNVKAVVTLCAFNPIAATKDIPYLFITGNRDVVASPSTILRRFNEMRNVSVRAYANFNGLNHLDPINFGGKHTEISRYTVAWMKSFLVEDSFYLDYLKGNALDDQLNDRRVFQSPRDYIYFD